MERTLEQKRQDRFSLIQSTIMDFENYVFPKYIQNYKTYLGFMLERYTEIEPWQSNVDFPLVAATVDTVFSNIYDFGFKFNIEDDKLRHLCNKAFDFRQCGKLTISSAAKEALIIGKSFVRDFFLNENYTENFFDTDVNFEIKTPNMEYVSAFDVFYDRSMGIDKSPYKIIRSYSSGNEIRSKSISLWLSKIRSSEREAARKGIEAHIDSILARAKDKNSKPFSYYNANNIKDLTYVTPALLQKLRQASLSRDSQLKQGIGFLDSLTLPFRNVESTRDENNFFCNKNNTVYETLLFNTKEEVVLYINGELIYEGKKNYNIGEIREVSYGEVPGTGNSQGVTDTLSGLQNIINGIWNGFLDNMKLQLGDMFEISGNNPFMSRDGKITYEKFKAYRTNQPGSIRRIELGVKDFTPINVLQVLMEFTQQRSGVNQYMSGAQGRAERVAGGIDVIINQYKSRLTPITDSINRMMTNVARSWVMAFLKNFTIEELSVKGINVEVVEDTEKKTKNVQVNSKDIKDILDEDKISFSFDSLYKVEMENNRAILKEMMQYILQYASNKINLTEYMKALLGFNFDIKDIFTDEKGFEETKKSYVNYDNQSNPIEALNQYNNAPQESGDISTEELSNLEQIVS